MFKEKKIMAKKLTWTESFKTTLWYESELSDEEYELYESDSERFFDEVDYLNKKELVKKEVSDEISDDFEIKE
jgi:hypothetical protein